MKFKLTSVSPLSIIKLYSMTLFFIVSLFLLNAEAEVIDRVVAEVNDDVITLSEVEEEGQSMYQRIVQEAPPEERIDILAQAHREILEGIIDKTLIAQEAAKQGITVPEEEIDGTIEQIIAGNNVSREDFFAELLATGIDERLYRDNLKSQIYQNKLVSREVRSKIVITEDMILDFYDNEYTSQVSEGSFYLLQIGTGWQHTESQEQSAEKLLADKADARKKVERIHKLALGGQDFRDLARRFSDLPSAQEGGDIGVFAEDEMAAYMKDAVTSLRAGEVSGIVETPVGYQFFKLLSSKEGGIVMQAPYDSVKEEIRERLFREIMQQDVDSWVKDMRDRAYIRIL
jgi:peptidyl-prolyl cis-trans isomerase SurA